MTFTPSPQAPALVIGAATLDVIGMPEGQLQSGISNPARIRFSFGGVARNVVQFAEMSLLAGAASSAAVVTPEIVQQVHDELLSLRA